MNTFEGNEGLSLIGIGIESYAEWIFDTAGDSDPDDCTAALLCRKSHRFPFCGRVWSPESRVELFDRIDSIDSIDMGEATAVP